MKIFLDSAEINEIKTHQNSGFVDGVTTNPSLITKSGRNILETIAEICTLVDGPVSAEVTATDFETMLIEGIKLAAIAPNVAVKVPLTDAGLMGADVVTLPPKILSSLYKHPLTDSGLDAFMADWRQTGQCIL